MKITCSKNQFLYGVNTVSKAVSNKTTMDILQCILIEAYDDCIKLTANDTELGIETVIEGTIIEPGKIALEAKIFSEIIKKFQIMMFVSKQTSPERQILNVNRFSAALWEERETIFHIYLKLKKKTKLLSLSLT